MVSKHIDDPVIIFWVHNQEKWMHGPQKDMYKIIYGIYVHNSYKLEIQIPISSRMYMLPPHSETQQ